MSSIVIEEFSKKIKREDLIILNNLLKNERLSIDEKQRYFLIAIFLSNDIKNDNRASIFIEFCYDKEINGSILFKKLIDEFVDGINEKSKEKQDILNEKIYTICNISLNDNRVMNDKILIDKIWKSSLEDISYSFIRELYDNYFIDDKKRNFVMDILLSNNVIKKKSCIDSWDIIMKDDILILPDNIYIKFVEFVLKNINNISNDLIYLLTNEKLSNKKKDILLNYFIDKNLSNIEISSLIKLFSDYKFSLICDEYFRSIFASIVNSVDFMAYGKVLISDNVNVKKQKIALDLINTVDEKISVNTVKVDKTAIAVAALSPTLANCSDDDYINILSKINDWCNELALMEQDKKVDNRVLFGSINRGVCRLLYNDSLYSNNIERLLITIDKLLAVKNSEFAVNNLIRFADSECSKYYGYDEYLKILDIILVSTNKGCFNEVFKLFTNINVSFMDDKNMLFEVAYTYDVKRIKEVYNQLENVGYINSNVETIFAGVSFQVKNKLLDKKDLWKVNKIG